VHFLKYRLSKWMKIDFPPNTLCVGFILGQLDTVVPYRKDLPPHYELIDPEGASSSIGLLQMATTGHVKKIKNWEVCGRGRIFGFGKVLFCIQILGWWGGKGSLSTLVFNLSSLICRRAPILWHGWSWLVASDQETHFFLRSFFA